MESAFVNNTFAPSLNKNISYVGLGTVKLGRDQGVKYPEAFKIPDDQEAANLIALAKDLGVNVIDTAPAYGNSETRLGHLLKNQREEWVIVSKAGEEFEAAQSYFDFSKAHIIKSVKRSLQRLNTDYLDVLLIHSNGEDEKIIHEYDVFSTLDSLKQEGLILSGGLSAKTLEGGRQSLTHADATMLTLNPFETEMGDLIRELSDLNRLVFIKKAFASGHAYHAGSKNAYTPSDIFEFLAAYPAISSVIVGTINPVHLRENITAAG